MKKTSNLSMHEYFSSDQAGEEKNNPFSSSSEYSRGRNKGQSRRHDRGKYDCRVNIPDCKLLKGSSNIGMCSMGGKLS